MSPEQAVRETLEIVRNELREAKDRIATLERERDEALALPTYTTFLQMQSRATRAEAESARLREAISEALEMFSDDAVFWMDAKRRLRAALSSPSERPHHD